MEKEFLVWLEHIYELFFASFFKNYQVFLKIGTLFHCLNVSKAFLRKVWELIVKFRETEGNWK